MKIKKITQHKHTRSITAVKENHEKTICWLSVYRQELSGLNALS